MSNHSYINYNIIGYDKFQAISTRGQFMPEQNFEEEHQRAQN